MPRKPKNPNRGLPWGGGSVRQRGTKWEARWRDGDVHRSKTFATEVAGWDWLIDLARGRAFAPATMTVREMIEDMLAHAEGRLADGTIYSYRGQAAMAIYPYLGERRAADLGPLDIQRWIDRLRGRYKPSSIRLAVAVLSTAYSEARRLQLVPSNPVSGVRRPGNPRGKPAVWTLAEARAVIAHVTDDPIYGALYLVALITGMRPGELLALHWADVDLDRGAILVCATLAHDRAGRTVRQPGTKGHEDRVVSIPDAVRDRLVRHRQAQGLRRSTCPTWCELGFVFDRGDGRCIDRRTWGRFHERVCAASGVPRIVLHGLRHSSATFELEANTHGKIVSERLGHKDPAFTMRFYQHVRPLVQEGAADALTAHLVGASVRTPVRGAGRNRAKPQRKSRIRQR